MYSLLAIVFSNFNLIALSELKNWSKISKDSFFEDSDLRVLDKVIQYYVTYIFLKVSL